MASIPGAARSFSKASARPIGDRTLTIFEGGTSAPLALVAAENAAAKMTVKVLRARRRHRRGRGARDRPEGLADRRGPLQLSRRRIARPKPSFDLPVELRNDIARLEIRGERSRRRGAIARQALAPPRHRRRHADRPAIPRSRCWPRRSISPARWRRSPTSGSAIAARRSRRSRSFSTRSCR